MDIKTYSNRYIKFALIIALVFFTLNPFTVLAEEETFLAEDVPEEENSVPDDLVSIQLPLIHGDERSPFDFIIDPQELIFQTDAAMYGGGVVEQGALLLFQNKEGEYDFSRYSDRLTVTNRSDTAVKVKLTARVEDLGEIVMSGEDSFSGDDCAIYLALIDDEEALPIPEEGVVTKEIILQSTSSFEDDRPSEGEGSEENEVSTETKTVYDSYSFGLVGACNPDGRWAEISVHPKVTVIWAIEKLKEDETDIVNTDINNTEGFNEKDAEEEETVLKDSSPENNPDEMPAPEDNPGGGLTNEENEDPFEPDAEDVIQDGETHPKP